MRTLAIINPHSAGGRTGREATAIARKLSGVLGPLQVQLTDGPMAAARIATVGLAGGIDHVVAVGGDGTLSEVVNGFFQDGEPVNREAVLSFVMTGTGGDFRKTFGIAAGIDNAIAAIRDGRLRRIDIGRISFLDDRGAPCVRHFCNIASFGLSGEVVRAVNAARISKLFGGRIAFAWNSAAALLRYRGKAVRLRVDGAFDEILEVSTVAVCNGQFFGGGMRIAPHAAPDDGHFDVVVMRSAPRREMMRGLQDVYRGAHLDNPKIKLVRGRRVIAAPVADTKGAPVLLDVDGEAPGKLPATFDVLPQALTVRC